MTKKNQKVITIISLIFLGVCLSIFIWQGIYSPKAPDSSEVKTFSVAAGEGTKEISINLKKQGLINNCTLFRIYTLTVGTAEKLQAGDYLLSPSMTIPEIVRKLTSGDIVKQSITIIEGWNIQDISFYLKEQQIAAAEDFNSLADSPEELADEFDFLNDKPETLSLEGYLFPDTYEIKKIDTAEEIIRKMLENFDQKLTPELREKIKEQNKAIFQIITMASLIEKEVRTMTDKKIVAGILWKRFEVGMPLQIDATISYITGKNNGKVSIADTQIDSPYNTYKYRGLPLGPIANPGLDSILAAVSPQESGFWYYLSTPDGRTVFSKTLDEHNAARLKYLR